MSKAILVVETSPVSPEVEDEYNDWYTNRHLEDVVAVPGFGFAKRYLLQEVPKQPGGTPKQNRYLAIYELETDDVKAAGKALGKALKAGMFISDSLDQTIMEAHYYLPIPGAERTSPN